MIIAGLQPGDRGITIDADDPAKTADAGDLAAVDRFVDRLAIQAKKFGELVDRQDG
jgi:hypothetical protein